jgi:hypothetical protein
MKKSAGLWIDHEKAVVVFITGTEEETKLIHSNIEKNQQSVGSVRADDVRLRVFTERLRIYYETVISYIRDAESILIFGPGEAKGELKKRLEIDNLGERIAGVETADKMTDPQIAAKVRNHFLLHSAAGNS